MSTIRPANLSDLERVCRTCTRAFATDPLIRWMLPDDEAYAAWQGQTFFRLVSRRWLETGEVWMTDDGVAVSIWGSPEPTELSDSARDAIIADYQRFDGATHERLAEADRSTKAHHPTEPHWYLQFLATHPDWQRQGLATRTMAQVRQQCDDRGLGQYLETATDDDIAFYRARGFEVTESWALGNPGDTVTITGMWRNPDAS